MPLHLEMDAFDRVRENVKSLVELCKGTNTEIHSNHLITDNDNRENEVENLTNLTLAKLEQFAKT